VNPRYWLPGATLVLLVASAGAAACGGDPAQSPPKSAEGEPAKPEPASPRAESHAEGIGLGNIPAIFDAGPDAHWRAIDAAAFRGKQINGRLAPEKIQTVVRAGFGSMRKCYEAGLRASPNLSGRVTIKFVIDMDGNVQSAADEGSDYPDVTVIQCVAEAFKKLHFPRPEGGNVTVVYPIIFNPGE